MEKKLTAKIQKKSVVKMSRNWVKLKRDTYLFYGYNLGPKQVE